MELGQPLEMGHSAKVCSGGIGRVSRGSPRGTGPSGCKDDRNIL